MPENESPKSCIVGVDKSKDGDTTTVTVGHFDDDDRLTITNLFTDSDAEYVAGLHGTIATLTAQISLLKKGISSPTGPHETQKYEDIAVFGMSLDEILEIHITNETKRIVCYQCPHGRLGRVSSGRR